MSETQMLEQVGDSVEAPETVGLHTPGAENVTREPHASAPVPDPAVGVLIGFRDDGRTPLVLFRGQVGHAAVPARSTQDLHSVHIGRQVVLLFEDGDRQRPIIVGCLQRADAGPLENQVGSVEMEADGARLIVTATEQLVLRCGKASITLTKAGKVLIQGAYVSSQSSGTHRIKGGSVQIN